MSFSLLSWPLFTSSYNYLFHTFGIINICLLTPKVTRINRISNEIITLNFGFRFGVMNGTITKNYSNIKEIVDMHTFQLNENVVVLEMILLDKEQVLCTYLYVYVCMTMII